jgi:transposase-like protein
MRVAEPDRWAALVREALERSQGCVPPAAEELGVSARTLRRWQRQLEAPRWQRGRRRPHTA